MDLENLRAYCLAFPRATQNLQWGDDLCFKVGGKIFSIIALDAVPQSVCFKCSPETFSELVEQEGIVPAPYVGRYKWVLVERLDVLRDHELEDLIRQSYEMVAAKAPKSGGNKFPAATEKMKTLKRNHPKAAASGIKNKKKPRQKTRR
jgi:predicted DNA-binding protein (MmcQ/YjbR family)